MATRVLFAFSSLVTNPAIFDKVPYDPLKDFAPVTLLATAPAVLCVNASVRAKTVQELVSMIRASGSKFSFASGGTGTQPHLAGEQFRLSLGLDLVHVPFNGGGPALASVAGGHAPMSFTTLTPAVPHVKEGRLRALAVTGKSRSASVPDVPTMTEAGYPEVDADTWVGVIVPAGTDIRTITLLHDEIVKLLGVAEIKDRSGEPGLRACRQLARRIRYADQSRSREMAKGHCCGRHQAAVKDESVQAVVLVVLRPLKRRLQCEAGFGELIDPDARRHGDSALIRAALLCPTSPRLPRGHRHPSPS